MFGKKFNELIIPPIAKTDASAQELLRVWVAQGNMHISLSPEAWEEPGTWGIALVDIARHVANHYSQSKGVDREAILARIKSLFEAEWNSQTSPVTGDIVKQ